MKKTTIVILTIITGLMLMAGCSLSEDQPVSPGDVVEIIERAGIELPDDIILDELITDNGEFNFSTVRSVPVKLTLKDENSIPVSKAVITVTADSGEEITRAVSNDLGEAEFAITTSQTTGTLDIKLEHAEYSVKEIKVTEIEQIALVNRELYTSSRAVSENVIENDPTSPPPPDSDGDGIPDHLDQFPFDADITGYSTSEFTIAYEDYYPEKGDADFNDVVVSLRFMEYYNDNNEIVKISVFTKILAAGAGYRDNRLCINIRGVGYTLSENTKDAVGGQFNSGPEETFYDAETEELVIVFEQPISRSEISPFPYDPFVRVQNEEGREVHLPFVETSFTGDVLDTDGFPWAIMIPKTWCWPFEQQDIRGAYTQFEMWYTSEGTEHQNWYLDPDLNLVFIKEAQM